MFIYTEAAVGIPIEGKSHIQAVFHDMLLQGLNMGGTAALIDINAIGIVMYHICPRPQCVKDVLGNHPCAAVGAVQANL